MEEDWEMLHAADVALLSSPKSTAYYHSYAAAIKSDYFVVEPEDSTDCQASADPSLLPARSDDPSHPIDGEESDGQVSMLGNSTAEDRISSVIDGGVDYSVGEISQASTGLSSVAERSDDPIVGSAAEDGEKPSDSQISMLGDAWDSVCEEIEGLGGDSVTEDHISSVIDGGEDSSVGEIGEASTHLNSVGERLVDPIDGSAAEEGCEEIEALGGDLMAEDQNLSVIDGGVSQTEGFGGVGDERSDEVSGGEVAERSVGDVVLGSSSGGEKKEVVWWKVPFELLKLYASRVRPVWSISVAVAILGFMMLGRRLYRMKHKSRSIPLKIAMDEKKASQLMVRAAKLNEAFSVVRRVPIIKSSVPVGGAFPWPMLPLR